MSIIADVTDAEITHLYGFARTNFKKARAAGQRNPEGISLLTNCGTIIWGGSFNEEGLSAGEDLRRIRAQLSPHEQFQMAVIATSYDNHTHKNTPASHDIISTLQQIRGEGALFVKIISPEDRGTQAFILS